MKAFVEKVSSGAARHAMRPGVLGPGWEVLGEHEKKSRTSQLHTALSTPKLLTCYCIVFYLLSPTFPFRFIFFSS